MKRTRGLRARSFRREYKTNIRRSRKLVVWKYYFLKRLTARIPSPRRRRAPPARAQAPAYSGPRPVPAPRHYLACRIPPSRSRGAPRACLRRPTRPPHSTQPNQLTTQLSRPSALSQFARHVTLFSPRTTSRDRRVKWSANGCGSYSLSVFALSNFGFVYSWWVPPRGLRHLGRWMRALSRCGHFHFIRIVRIPRTRADRAAAADPARAPFLGSTEQAPSQPRSPACYRTEPGLRHYRCCTTYQ